MTTTIMPQGRQRYYDNDGVLAVGCLLYAFAAGTTTPQATYQDAAGTVPHAHPIELDAKGEAVIYWSGTYKVDLKTAAGAQITGWPVDNLTAPVTPGDLSGATGAGLMGFIYATAYGVGTIGRWLKDLALAAGAGFIGTKSSLANTVLTTQAEVNERIRNVFDWLTVAERAAVRAGTVLDITTNVQAAIDSGSSLEFPEGTYYVKKLTFDEVGKTYRGNNSQIVAIDTAPQRGVIDYKGSSCRFYAFNIVGAWKSNYVAAVWWHSASAGAPAQSTTWYGVSFDNVLVGWLFGDLVLADPLIALTGVTYQAPVDAAQSENYVYGCIMRGVEQAIYSNQPNGFIKFVGGKIYSSKSEWDIASSGVYSFTRSCPITVLDGVVGVYGDAGKTDTQLGSGIKVSGGGLDFSGNLEIASQVLTLAGGTTHLHDITGSAWGNAATDWANLSGTSGTLVVSNVVVNKAAGAAAAATAFINFSSASGWDVTLDQVRAENQLYWVFRNAVGGADRWVGNTLTFRNCTAPLAGGAVAANPFARISTSTYNLLDMRGTDVNANDVATWFKRDLVGVGTISINADFPVGSGYLGSVQMDPGAGGTADLTSVNLATLATVKATAIKCRPGDTFGVAGWVRMTTVGQCTFLALYEDAAGAALADGNFADHNDIITNSWKYIEAIFTAPASAAYFGVGLRATSSTICRLVGLKVYKLA